MQLENLKKIDSADMFSVIKSFPGQVREAIKIGKTAPLFNSKDIKQNILILGMGGSAIGGDLLRSYSAAIPGADHLNININRNYDLPGFVDDKTFVIASSYSGTTEETLTSFEKAANRTDRLHAITTGGELEIKSKQYDTPVIKIPGGLQPRAALGYSFFPLLYLMIRSGAYDQKAAELTYDAIDETLEMLDRRSAELSELRPENPAIRLAQRLRDRAAIIYSADQRTDAINRRWRGQIQENAKQAAFGNLLPEMNHNEINGWSYPDGFAGRAAIIMMRDPDDHPKVKVRFDAIEELLSDKVKSIYRIEGRGEHLLARMFDLIYMGDWVSYYLAIMNSADPTPIPLIMRLKEILSEK
ncbi:MAG: bifunctional phosphoglucose/phosphomannose isomerase [Candidatus Kapaibacterium sp.]